MKFYLFSLLFSFAVIFANAQQTMIGLKISFGGTLTSVKDKDLTPSGAYTTGFATNPGDGETKLVKSGASVGFAFTFDLPVHKKIYFATGLNFYSKAFTISNRDGGYYGFSSFGTTYLQIPLTAKVYIKEINDKLALYAKFGPTFDIKLKEKLKSGDGSHYWNLANNDYRADPYRGRNGDNTPKALFHPVNIGLLFGFGGEYKLTENIVITAGINYNPSFVNMINPSLKLNDQRKTRVGELLKIRTSVIVLEAGAALLF
jgi:hypothetical protein